MFSREEASRIREEFWTAFGKYMSPVPSANGLQINWVNYHTGIKDVHFRMNVGKKSAEIGISFEHRDAGIQQLYFEQLEEFKILLQEALQEEWTWAIHAPVADQKVISKVYKEISDVSVFNKNHWPEIISFFKPRIIALDSFWEDARYGFDGLR